MKISEARPGGEMCYVNLPGCLGPLDSSGGRALRQPVPRFPTSNKEEFARAQDTMEEIFQAALSLGGVLSGEHGIGLEKQRLFNKAIDPVALDIMRKIKRMLDPNNILNPGKIWVEEET